MKFNKLILVLVSVFTSSTINASTLRILNGIEYEWLELTETAGLSRNEVELRLADPDDVLYGYEYASRSLVESLYLSYSSFDGISGRHSDPGVINGGIAFLNDFGHTIEQDSYGGYITVEGELIERTTEPGLIIGVYGLYGLQGECQTDISASYSCTTSWSVYTDSSGAPRYSWQSATQGWDSTYAITLSRLNTSTSSDTGSLLVRSVATVPVPAAAWLFSSGLLGLIGVARQKKAA